jgi:succinate dehydrogenase/fumarate reductase flavoprotein subunit
MASDFDTDVLVLGGGPAGTWAALTAASGGARVVLADKGFCGSSGATAAAGTGVWYVPPDPVRRQAAMDSRDTLGGHLADPAWMARVLDRTWHGINELAEYGYPFPLDQDGTQRRNSLQGPEYMRLMRRRVKGAGVQILDQAPALELLIDKHGAVAGAAGVYRQQDTAWTGRAKAVVIATGGCAFLSNGLGCNVLTGDGYLMAAEAGAEFSGMEFSNAYAISPSFASVTKTLFYSWATFTAPSGAPIPGAASKGGRSVIAKWLQHGAVYAQLDKADGATQAAMRAAQPNFFLPFDRAGINPFTQRFRVTLRLEGTVRGTGGLRIIDETCATSVPGLYAAGDAATRELICGGFTGGGSHNAAWAMSSGHWAGRGASDHARAIGSVAGRQVRRAGGVALADGGGFAMDAPALVQVVQGQVFPYETNYFRTADGLETALTVLDAHWAEARGASPASRADAPKSREAAAMLATARWMYRSALARTETRGMHRRLDYTATDPTQRHAFASGGLDEVWVRPLPPVQRSEQELAA